MAYYDLYRTAILTPIGTRLRHKRYDQFVRLVGLRPEDRVLDLGCGPGHHFGAMNNGRNRVIGSDLFERQLPPQWYESFVQADACDMSMFRDGEFDVVFCNSLIEHIPTWEGQAKAAREIMRVGKRVWVQTPNRRFPVEPHFGVPLAQWLTDWDERAASACWMWARCTAYSPSARS